MISTCCLLYGYYQEKKKATKAIDAFEKFTKELREKLLNEEGQDEADEEPDEQQQQNNEQDQEGLDASDDDGDDGKKSAWRIHLANFISRIKSCYGICRVKCKNKRFLDILFLLGMFLLMQAVGSLFYIVIALKFSTYSQTTGTFVSIGAQTIMFLVLLSRYLRVIFFVTLPSLFTGRLRAILVIMMLIWAFQFPAQNVTSNIQSAMEGVNCVSQRVKEVTQEVKRRAGHAFRDAPLEQMREFLKSQAKPFEQIRETMRKLDDSLEKMLAWQRELIKKLQGLTGNCTVMAELPFKACVGWLNERHAACEERFFETICKPIHLVKGLCYVTKVLELTCEWPSRVKESIKEGVSHFVKGAKRRVSDYAKQTFMYDLYNKTIKQGKIAYDTLEIAIQHEHNYTEELELDKARIQRELHNEIAAFESFLDFVVFLLDLLMIALTVWPFLLAVLYVRRFSKKESVDNRYIDKHFIDIDNARALNGQTTLLPLLPKEKKRYITTCSLQTNRKERLLACVSHMLLIFSVIPVAIFILVDIVVYKLIRKTFIFFHGNSTIFRVPSIYKLKVSGDGLLNQLLANILHTFEPLTDAQERDQMWRQCFVEPSPPNYELFEVILLMYIVCAISITIQTYAKRLKHLIALHYFPEMARPRALYLYDKILTKRLQMFDLLVDVQKSNNEEKEVTDGERQLLLKGMAIFSEDKQRCYRCARTDLSVQEISNIRLCVRCHAIYCVDCYIARQRCLRPECHAPLQAITDDIELYVDSSCEDDDDDEVDADADAVDASSTATATGGNGETNVQSETEGK